MRARFSIHQTETEKTTYDSEPRKYEIDDVVDSLQHKNDFTTCRVSGAEYLFGVGYRVYCSKEGTIKPSSSLTYELGKCVGNIRLSNCSFYVSQNPM